MPNWANVIPESILITQTKLPTIETYSFATDLSFDAAKAAFAKSLGTGWKEQKVDAETRTAMRQWLDAKGKENEFPANFSIFTNTTFPNLFVGITAYLDPSIGRLGKKYLMIITVLRMKEAEPSH